MIIVTVDVTLEEDRIAELGDAFREMDAATAKEPGCIRYVSSVDVNDARKIRIFEVWDSMEVLEPHFQTPHMAAFQQALSGISTVSMDAKVYQIDCELPFPN